VVNKKRIIVGVTGASGVIMAQFLLRTLREFPEIETHLITTESARLTWKLETAMPFAELCAPADYVHDEKNMAANIASGSFVTAGMVVIPCSMKSLAGIVSGYTDNLLLRAADVCLKENRRLVLVPRETPLGKVHLRNLNEAANLGCTIIPPMLTFYNNPQSLDDQINHIIGKILLAFGLQSKSFKPWEGE
jgi:4-hydroxy-3-polyprenylbenzoate decarboxylase